MINIFLIIMMVVIPIILLLINLYVIVYFQQPEERGVNFIWRIIIIIGLELCEISILLIPADVMNAGPPEGGIPMEIIWYVVYYVLIAMVALVLPFGLCWFNMDAEDKFIRKAVFSVFFTGAFLFIVAVFSIIFYLIFGVAEIPMKFEGVDTDWSSQVYTSTNDVGIVFNDILKYKDLKFDNSNYTETDKKAFTRMFGTKVNEDKETGIVSFRISWVLFLIAGVSTIGFALVVAFGGIGFGILPVDLIFGFVNRPQPIKDADKKRYMKIIGEKAIKMMDESKNIKGTTGFRNRRKYNKFREDVYILDRALRTLQKRADMKGFLWGYVSLIIGILSCVCSLLWCIQLILSLFDVPYALFDFIMSWMTGPLSFFGIIFYGIFAVYLFCAAFKAVRYIGFRFGIGFLFFPMEVSNTYMNAFCFNTILLAFVGFGTNTLCSEVFATFTSGTSIEMFLGNSITELRYVKYLYQYTPIIMPVLAVVFITFLLLSKLMCKHQKEKDDLEILLEKEHVNEKE